MAGKIIDETNLPDLWACIGEKFGRMAIGSYIGTGTFGSSAPTSLTFDFVPEFVLVRQTRAYNNKELPGYADGVFKNYFMVPRETLTAHIDVDTYKAAGTASGSDSTLTFTWEGKTVSWYSADTNSNTAMFSQLNYSGREYEYFAFGR